MATIHFAPHPMRELLITALCASTVATFTNSHGGKAILEGMARVGFTGYAYRTDVELCAAAEAEDLNQRPEVQDAIDQLRLAGTRGFGTKAVGVTFTRCVDNEIRVEASLTLLVDQVGDHFDIQRLVDAVDSWVVNSPAGRAARLYAGGPLNIGDVLSYLEDTALRTALRCQGLTVLPQRLTEVNQSVPYDLELSRMRLSAREEVA